MVRETPAQQSKVRRVMHEFKHGELESSRGGKVRNPRQAIAIGLSEAGISRKQSPGQQRRNGSTRKELYEQATRRGIAGRARMSKDELAKALGR